MSEFQYIGFRAIDAPLSDSQLQFMKRQSSSAKITRRSFDNTYHFGDFHGDADEMLQRGYDVHLHYANFGIRRLSLRLPQGLPLSGTRLSAYLDGEMVRWCEDPNGSGGILTLYPELEPGCLEDLWDLDEHLDRLVDLRKQLIDGDTRPLYAAWLCACDCGALDPDGSMEPPVPAGLADPPDALEALLEFFEVDAGILAAAAENSQSLGSRVDQTAAIGEWLETVDPEQMRAWLLDLLAGESDTKRSECLRLFRESSQSDEWPSTEGCRTFSEILQRSHELAEERQKEELDKSERARRRLLADMASSPEGYLGEVDRLVAERSRRSYDQAAQVLADVREAVGGMAGETIACDHAMKIREKHPTLSLLTGALRRQGLLP